ncbi:MAG TPA: hypothetical protein VGF76_00075 [Polyangiaceae bacterium]
MRIIGTLQIRPSLARRSALPLLSCAAALGLGTLSCGSTTPAPSPSEPNGGSSPGASGSASVAGSSATGGSTSLAGGASNGGVGQSGGGGAEAAGGAGSGGVLGGAGAISNAGSSASGGTSGAGGAQTNGGAGGAVAAANGCDGVTAKFCDDFEKQTSGQAPVGDFKVSASAGAMIVDGTKPHGGKQSLHIKMAKPGTRAMLDFTKQFPFNDLHGRAMMFISKIPTSDIHWDLVYSYSNVEWELGGQDGVFALVIDPPDHEVSSKNKIPTGQWFCLQWEFNYAGAGADNSYAAKTDGVTIDKGAWTGADPSGMKWTAGPWKNLSVGWESYGGSDVDIEIWIDDLAFGDQVIPCPAP